MLIQSTACEFLIISVRPKFADAIVDGRKTIEVRRKRPSVQPGTLGLVYSSSPVQAVVGSFRVDRILSGTPDELWQTARQGACISKQDFDSYFTGADFGHAIVVSCGKRLPTPIKLTNLRAVWPGCMPPRSYGYLVAADTYSKRIMSAFKAGLFTNRTRPTGSNERDKGGNGEPAHKGSFRLGSNEVRVLASLLGLQSGSDARPKLGNDLRQIPEPGSV